MNDSTKNAESKSDTAAVTLPGTVDKVIPAVEPVPGIKLPEKVQIAVEGTEPLYGEIQLENKFHDEAGNPVRLKLGAEVEVTIEAKPEGIESPKSTNDRAVPSVSSSAGAKKTSAQHEQNAPSPAGPYA